MPVNKSALLRYRIIDSCLTNKLLKFPTLEQIQKKIEDQLGDTISVSMINKDFSEMRSNFKAPIEYDRNRKGYYYSEEGFSLKEFPLTNEEIEALDFSTALLQQIKGTKIFDQFENAINKVIEGYRISKILAQSGKKVIQIEEPLKTVNGNWLEMILRAIVEEKTLEIRYQAFGKPEKIHIVSPYLLKEYRNRWYVVGYSDRAESIIIFALDRILQILEYAGIFQKIPEFNPDDYFQYSFGITHKDSEGPANVELSFSAQQAPYIISQPLHHSQEIILENEKEIRVRYRVYISQELKMTILSFGSEVKIIKPLRLKNEIKNIVKKMAKHYKL
ncbi:MAG: WYL domain-containing protein [Bacteroidota bacterium]|nr:WYL domain-containing protein [Bacteroidota bacterium]